MNVENLASWQTRDWVLFEKNSPATHWKEFAKRKVWLVKLKRALNTEQLGELDFDPSNRLELFSKGLIERPLEQPGRGDDHTDPFPGERWQTE